MSTWHIAANFTVTPKLDLDAVFDVETKLEDLAAVMSVARAFDAGSVAVTVDASAASEAFTTATTRITEAFTSVNVTATITGINIQTTEEFDRELSEPIYPEVVSYAEIAKIEGVSRQRARQFADTDTFPKPVIKTGQGPLYSRHAVENWLANRKAPAMA